MGREGPAARLRMGGERRGEDVRGHLGWLGPLIEAVGQLPGGAVAQKALHQRGMHGVAGALGDDAALDTAPGEREVADEVEHLVADELVGKAEWTVLHAQLGEDDGAGVGHTADEAHVAQLWLVFLEAEGARGGDQARVVAGLEVSLKGGEADGLWEVDGVVDAVAAAGVDADELRAVADLDLLEDADVLAAAALLLETNGLERLDVRQRRCASLLRGIRCRTGLSARVERSEPKRELRKIP
jgi:hypothetical protein